MLEQDKVEISETNKVLVAEDLCLSVAQALEFPPVTANLFGLYDRKMKLWKSPSDIVEVTKHTVTDLYFLVRFHVVDLSRIISLCKGEKMLNYYFHQARRDFLDGFIEEVSRRVDEFLGLSVTDMYRVHLERGTSPDAICRDYRAYIPSDINRKHPFFLNNKLRHKLQELINNCQSWQTGTVKEIYLKELMHLSPGYFTETYDAFMEIDGEEVSVKLKICHVDQSQPGVKYLQSKKSQWRHICEIEELCYVSVKADFTLELSRTIGTPSYLRFNSDNEMRSFISCIDGYYRLSRKFIFNLCREMPTPALMRLKKLKSHGPVGSAFASRKLKEKKDWKMGSFLIRQCEFSYNVFWLDVNIRDGGKPSHIRIQRRFVDANGEEEFCLPSIRSRNVESEQEWFRSLSELLSCVTAKGWLPLKDLVYPSDYDRSEVLLLCERSKGKMNNTEEIPSHKMPLIIKDNMLSFSEGEKRGHFTLVRHAKWQKTKNLVAEVAVKSLKKEFSLTYWKTFLDSCNRSLFWESDCLVECMGMCLTSPHLLVMPWFSLGRLDLYLRSHRQSILPVDLIEAATYLARALWYLSDCGLVHGKIRCHNVLVASHGNNEFKVKLADPGPLIYLQHELPWIPLELHDSMHEARKSRPADVWALGTTLWELFSYGQQPFAGRSLVEMQEHYKTHVYLDKPESCMLEEFWEVYETMKGCWHREQSGRIEPQTLMRDLHLVMYFEDQGDVEEKSKVDEHDLLGDRDISWKLSPLQVELGRERLGQGFYGEVWKGTLVQDDGLTRIPVAIKKLKHQSLHHPNVVEIKGMVEEPLQLVMEFIPMGSLSRYLHCHKHRLTPTLILRFALNIAQMGLDGAKPGNLSKAGVKVGTVLGNVFMKHVGSEMATPKEKASKAEPQKEEVGQVIESVIGISALTCEREYMAKPLPLQTGVCKGREEGKEEEAQGHGGRKLV
ncbi:unnamed protein product [Darwinula stevensoni]|uniref:Non-specific protein-tyrosine kinase n=1 Tax=Darwinula stevensoni TaxID=69355 RepID=A0A7R8X9I3_9CRUS|nr:unnamed protein product [Darwinula stevensoni]CAG0891134.1 unnamed protein product [Darwinula stevensoni]